LRPFASRSSAAAVAIVVDRRGREDDRVVRRTVGDQLAVRVMTSAPGDPATPPGAALRGCPRTIVPGRIVSVAPLFTKIGRCRQIGLGLAMPPQVCSR
jgi:hypothetical protein